MNSSVRIIYEDEALLVVGKPAGLAVQTKKFAEEDLESLLRKKLKERDSGAKEVPQLYPITRLDQPVEGLVLFAKTREAAAKLTKQLNDHSMKKIYRAEIYGSFGEGANGSLNDRLYKDGRTNTSIVVKPGNPNYKQGKDSSLNYEEIAPGILRIELLSGRHHQIRVQLANAGHPILGDLKYGTEASKEESKRREIKRLMLTAEELELTHPVSGEKVKVVYETYRDVL